MLLAPLFGTALVLAVATSPMIDSPGGTRSEGTGLTLQEKRAATEPLVRAATQCIVRAVIAAPEYAERSGGELGDLIVASVPACTTPVRAMIDGYDHYYGQGTGEAFFMGPYLDVLPQAVIAGGKNAVQ